MKILYTEGSLHRAGQQILVNAINTANTYLSSSQYVFRISFPDVDDIIDKTFDACNYAVLAQPGTQEPPRLGDIIWVETSGGKLIANCVIYDVNHHLNAEAFQVCLKSIASKAKKIGQTVIAMDLLQTDRNGQATLGDWNTIVTMIEEELEDTQVIVYVPEKKDLVHIIQNLPGEKTFRKFYTDPIIRFRNLGDKPRNKD